MADRLTEIYNLREMGNSELPPALSVLKPFVESKKWDEIISGWNNAITAAEQCRLTGRDGITESLFRIGDAMPDISHEEFKSGKMEEAIKANNVFWDALDMEITIAINEHCGCAKRIT